MENKKQDLMDLSTEITRENARRFFFSRSFEYFLSNALQTTPE